MSMQPPPPPTASAVSGSLLKRIWQGFVKAVTWPFRLSTPGKASFVTAVLLVLLAVVVWLIIRNDPKHVDLYHVLTVGRIVVVLLLIVVIPILVYQGLKLWLEVERSPYPEIDFAWKAGVQALADNGLSLQSIPVFLVLGAGNAERERSLMDASGRAFRVNGVPEGPAPLHWYANPDSAYLFCTEVGALSALSSLIDKGGMLAEPDFVHANVEPAAAAAPAAAVSGGAGDIRGTISVDQLPPGELGGVALKSKPKKSKTATLPPAGISPGGGANELRGTMMFQPMGTSVAESAPAPAPTQKAAPRRTAPARPAAAQRGQQPALLPAKDAAEQRRKLRYVCRKLTRDREPLCPANGLLTLLPFASVASGPAQADELEKSVRTDLATVQRTMQLRCPVTALVTGFEEEPGFAELVRRVGPERALVQRFGRGFDLRSVALAEELFAFCSHVTGAFEDWVYTLFREQDALLRPGNTRLYGLLCRVRFRFKAQLAEILADGFGIDPQRHPESDAFLFSGCYFAATGATRDRQAFVRGVFDKLEDEQESIEWTEKAIAAHRSRRQLAAAGVTLTVLLALTLVGMMLLPRG
jgi:IcmF-related N-terminal domain